LRGGGVGWGGVGWGGVGWGRVGWGEVGWGGVGWGGAGEGRGLAHLNLHLIPGTHSLTHSLTHLCVVLWHPGARIGDREV